jgi:hypothetical protein
MAVAQDTSSQSTVADNTADTITDQQLALLRRDIRSIKKQLIAENLTLTDSDLAPLSTKVAGNITGHKLTKPVQQLRLPLLLQGVALKSQAAMAAAQAHDEFIHAMGLVPELYLYIP